MALDLYAEKVGRQLPHAPIPTAVLLIVEEAMRTAWGILRQQPRDGFDLATAPEDSITHEFYEALYDEVFNKALVAGFDSQLFRVGVREAKLPNFDGSRLDMMPDLLVGLIGRSDVAKPTQDWLFVECKPVDADHSVGKHYCDKGLIRFVRGDYAWAMTIAMMVGYASAGYDISSKLVKALESRDSTIPTLQFPMPCPQSKSTSFSESVNVSRHKRTFNYPKPAKKAPPITIRHLWLRRD